MKHTTEQIRIYDPKEGITFRKTKGEFGGLSNMAGGYPLRVNQIFIPSAEALYQACRFPHKPEIQEKIIKQHSPMTAKMVSKPHRGKTRSDWMHVRVRIMRWVLRVKLAMHWPEFSELLLATGDRPIVEDSRRDDFWGAKKQNDGTLVGMNVLGRLLMELREELKGERREALRIVAPPAIPDFMLFGKPIGQVGFAGKAGDDAIDPDSIARPGTLWASTFEQSVTKIKEVATVAPSAVGSKEESMESRSGDRMMRYPKRLIEVDLPIKRISANARGEKNPLSTLHIWWARRPLAACRAVLCASLWPDPADELCPDLFREKARSSMQQWANKHLTLLSAESYPRFIAYQKESNKLNDNIELRKALLDFIADFTDVDNSKKREYLETTRELTQTAHETLCGQAGTRPLVVDPFAGGGSIPLEALRLGTEIFASDLNQIPVLINKVALELIPLYGDVLKDILNEACKVIYSSTERFCSHLYPKSENGYTPIAYLWARTIKCEGPSCGLDIPVLRSLWIDKRSRNTFAYRFSASRNNKHIAVAILKNPSVSDVKEGIAKRGSVTCPCCGYTTPRTRVENQAIESGLGQRLMAIVTETKEGRQYSVPTTKDWGAIKQAQKLCCQAYDNLGVMDEELPYLRSIFNVHVYGMQHWRDLFSDRQYYFLVNLLKAIESFQVKDIKARAIDIKALRLLLAFIFDKITMLSCNVTRWRNDTGRMEGAFSMMALPMVWDWVEWNPFNNIMSTFGRIVKSVSQSIEELYLGLEKRGTVQQGSATNLSLPDDSVALYFTDPPYYDYVPYANLADFFYVWLKRIIKQDYPEYFSQQETPKKEEIVQLAERNPKYSYKTKEFFEKNIQQAFAEGRRITRPNCIGAIVFAHKSTSVWETFLSAVINAGWVITASWPVDTELATRFKAINTASLSSSIHLICRPRENEDGSLREDDVGDWRDVLQKLPTRIHEWMPRLAEEGVVGADAIFACLGPALEIFSQYSYVEKASGEKVTLKEYLEHVWAAVEKEALNMIFEGADAAGFEEDSRLTAMWLWTLSTGTKSNGKKERTDEKTSKSAGYALEFDAARKIAQGLGAHLENLGRVVEIKGDKARLLSVAERTKCLFGKDESQAPVGRRKKKDSQMQLDFMKELQKVEREEGGWGEKSAPRAGETVLDQLHQAMILFAAGRGEAMKRFLVEEGMGRDSRFWRLAQALSALYPSSTDEKRWVDGVLARKKGLGF